MMADVAKLPRLKSSLLPEANDVTDAGLVHLRGLSRLEQLVIGPAHPGARSGEPPAVAPVQGLDLARCDLSDTELITFAGLSTLKQLGLTSTRITHSGMAPIAALTNLEELKLRKSRSPARTSCTSAVCPNSPLWTSKKPGSIAWSP